MSSHRIKVSLHIPAQNNFSSVQDLINTVAEPTDRDGQWWGGFKGKKYLVNTLEAIYEYADVETYTPLPKQEQQKTKEIIVKTLAEIEQILPPPKIDIVAHIYPWSQGDNMDMFDGVNGKTFFGNAFLIFIDTRAYTSSSLKNTTAHEYNHAVHNQYFSSSEQTIREAIVMEGLAEHFREDVVGGKPAPWSKALKKNEASFYLQKIESVLDIKSDNREIYGKVFYGNRGLPRWTGYSIEYHTVEEFLAENKQLSWPEIMKIPATEILNTTSK